MTGAPRAKGALVVIAIIVAGIAALAVRLVGEGRDALAQGDAAAAEGRIGDAIAGWETAARRYLPLAPHVDDAYARLTSLAGREHRHALSAWRAVRSAALATRHLWTPHADELAAANAAIAELASRDPEGAAAAGPDAAARKQLHTERLAGDRRAGTGALLLAIAGIACWLAGIGLVIRRGFDPAGQLARRPALTGAAVSVLGLAAWALGLAVA